MVIIGSSTSMQMLEDVRKMSRREWTALVLPWLSIVVVAFIGAAVSLSNDSGDTNAQRQLIEEVHHHKAVYNEEHASLFPLQTSDYYGVCAAVLGLMIAAGGGIGGGGILVPIYILVMGFSPKHAIPLSNVTVLGGAVANTFLNSRKRHPLADRPLVDWDLILVMEPLTIAGALIGAFLNKVLPELLLTILLVLLLSFTANKTLRKAVKSYKEETIAIRRATGIREDGTKTSELTRMAAENDEAERELLDDVEEQDQGEPPVKDSRMTELDQILEDEKTVPPGHLSILITMFVVVLAINLLKGGGAFPSPIGIKCGSASFWVANAAMLAWITIISLYVRTILLKKNEAKERCGYQYVKGDIKWDEKATVKYPLICCLAGFFAGMFGVGGGIVKGPLMLAMGVHPAVSSGSSATMILFTSFTATTSFIVFGLLVPDYAVVCLLVGFTATIVGQLGLSYLMKKNGNRSSYISFSIGGVVLISAFLMTIQSLLSMAAGEKHHSGGICGKGD